jgi:hypothetical protein
MPNMLPNHVGAFAVCTTRTALKLPLVEPVEVTHASPSLTRVFRHRKVGVATTLVSSELWFLSVDPEL